MKLDYSVNDLKKRIILEKAVVTVDDEMNRIPSFVPMREVYADVVPKSTANAYTGTGIDERVTYTVVIRKQALEGKIERITWNGVHYYPVVPWVETDKWMICEVRDA